MRLSATKPRERLSQSTYNTSYKIRAYDTDNGYPQKMLKAINNSPTAKSCIDLYQKFIRGNGLADPQLAISKANKKDTFSQLHNKLSADKAIFKGFAVHIGYNKLLEPVIYTHVPFEHCRYEVDNEKLPTGRIAIHVDWTKESGRQFKQTDIIYLNSFNPDKAQVWQEIQDAGGFENYKGQIFYACSEPLGTYPLAYADSVCTWMETEDSISNNIFRNARFNFLPSGILTVKKRQQYNSQNEEVDVEDGAFETAQSFQGDENALKMLVVEVESDEEKPDFTPFPVQNLDKMFEFSTKTAEEKIAKFFQIPPELRGVDTGSGFSPDRIVNAYDYYNSITESERTEMEEWYAQLFVKTGYTFKIEPKKYVFSTQTPAQ